MGMRKKLLMIKFSLKLIAESSTIVTHKVNKWTFYSFLAINQKNLYAYNFIYKCLIYLQ